MEAKNRCGPHTTASILAASGCWGDSVRSQYSNCERDGVTRDGASGVCVGVRASMLQSSTSPQYRYRGRREARGGTRKDVSAHAAWPTHLLGQEPSTAWRIALQQHHLRLHEVRAERRDVQVAQLPLLNPQRRAEVVLRRGATPG